MRIAIGCDHAAFNEKLQLIRKISGSNIEIEDFGCSSEDSVDYPDYAHIVCREMKNNNKVLEHDRLRCCFPQQLQNETFNCKAKYHKTLQNFCFFHFFSFF